MTDQDRQLIERINALSATARTSWLALLAFLAYVGITLLAVQDADFFVSSRRTDLPLVGISIPTFSFFIFAPPLAAALYIYLQIHLLKLWDALATAPARIDGEALGDRIHPWIANDFFLTLRAKYRRDASASARPLRRLSNLASRLMVWAFAPLVLAGFWWRSATAHNEWLTLWLALCLLVATYAGLSNWWSARTAARRPHRRPWPKPWSGGWKRPLGLLVALLLTAVSWLRTEPGRDARALLAPIDLTGAALVPLPADWRTPETARHAFRQTWCVREGLPMSVCDHPPSAERPVPAHLGAERRAWCDRDGGTEGMPSRYEHTTCDEFFSHLDARFEIAWTEERKTAVANRDRLTLAGSDLRGAKMRGASVIGADLSGARLEGADLSGARLERANLSRALAQGANLSGARLEGADLSEARLEVANLSGARLAGASLSEARLAGADLSGARLEGVDLSRAQLQVANFSEARLEKANLRFADFRGSDWAGASSRASPAQSADFRGGQVLTQAQLDQLIGNAETLLPTGPSDTGADWHVWNCWEIVPEGFDALIARIAEREFTDPERLRAEFLCGPNNPRRQTGTPCALELTREQCLDPAQNPHHPANRPR